MSIFKTIGYRNLDCRLSIAAMNPPERQNRLENDRKSEDELTFYLTITNINENLEENSTYIELNKKQLKELNQLLSNYLKTGITKEL